MQIERLEDHTARMTVPVEAERLEKAKQQAARKISGRVNIPGFRKGKAPYSILVRYFGEDAIVSDAFDLLTNEVYPEALGESGLEPYGPGAFLDFTVEPDITMVFSVPLQPTVELGGYREVRVAYEPPVVTDEDVARALRSMQEQNAVTEESARPVQLGDRVTVDIHSHVVREHEGEDEHDHDDAEEGEAHDHDHDHGHGSEEDAFIHEHDAPIILDADHEPLPGFGEALTGAAVGDARQFDLIVPDDAERYEDVAGKTVHFSVGVKRIENITLPALNDDLAARVTRDEERPLTLLELRVRVRENLERMAENRYSDTYARQVLDQMVLGATIGYPEALLADEVEDMLKQFDQQLRQQGFTLKDYMSVMRKTDQDMFNEYRPNAEQRVRRALTMREVMRVEQIDASNEELFGEIESLLQPVGEDQRDEMRQVLEAPGMRESVLDDLLRRKTTERIVSIGRGNAPAVAPDAADASEAST